jgi:hypothetical protein
LRFGSETGAIITFYDLLLGTFQGSILGPVLYAIFVPPLFDFEDFLAFAEDNFIAWYSCTKKELINDIER